MHFDFHNYTLGFFCQCIIQKEYWQIDLRKFGLITGEVTINYQNSIILSSFFDMVFRHDIKTTSSRVLWVLFFIKKMLIFKSSCWWKLISSLTWELSAFSFTKRRFNCSYCQDLFIQNFDLNSRLTQCST